ncbi:MAG: L,D-transpeptidase [Gammaproteobacteria bacterium]|nr:L,D-transpeptidase [Gammaproteobacteria bacterium]MCW5583024.1 L,D-transpeptidase [Gammaproteobacteria bacterium]
MQIRGRCFLLSLFLALIIPSSALALPRQINPPGEKMVLVSPREHAWGAYDANGRLIRSGLASAGADWCADVGRKCHTIVGTHRVRSLGSFNCVSPSFPLPYGGAPMPYCMYFNKYQALHGSYEVRHANISHGCVRMHVADAKWLRYNFVEKGTLVVILPY